MRRTMIWTLMAALLASPAALAQEGTAGQAEADARAAAIAAQEAYARAAAALDRGEYERAVDLYREISRQRGAQSDAASYWMAYAMAKNGQARAAMRAIAELRRAYPRSEWIDDARYLEAELRARTGGTTPGQTEAEEMRMYALNALIRRDPERALPALEAILQGDSSPEMKRRALFVLLQSGTDRGMELAAEVARSGEDRELRLDALRHLAIMGGPRGAGLLQELYDASDDPQVRIAVIEGWAVSGESDRLRQIARSDADEQVRLAAIRSLAITGDGAGLWELYDASESREIRAAILESVVMTGETGRLLQVLRSEQDPELRVAAIRGMAMMGRLGSGEEPGAQDAELLAELRGIYAGDDREVKVAVIESLAMQEQVPVLIELFEQESDPELRTQIVRAVSMSDSQEALDFLVRILEQGI